MPLPLIPFLLLAIPVAEIAAFILIGGKIGILWTFAMILLTAVIGSILLRVQGFQIINRLREESNAGRIPGKELGHGAMILVAGVLLLTPGFITDTLGFLLFVPFIRSLIWSRLASRVSIITPEGFGSRGRSPFNQGRDENVVDLSPEDFSHTGEKNDSTSTSSPWRKGIGDDQDRFDNGKD